MAEIHYPGGASSQAGRWQHVYPAWQEERHELQGYGCPCDPKVSIPCLICNGDGCTACGEDGWIFVMSPSYPAPDEPAVIVHHVLPDPPVENHVTLHYQLIGGSYRMTLSTDPDVELLS